MIDEGAAVDAGRVLAETVAAERLRIVATLIARTGDWELAEDAVQDAVARALTAWPRTGIPRNPGAWLTTAARNAAIDVLRRANTERSTMQRAAVEALIDVEHARSAAVGAVPDQSAAVLDDDRLRLIFTCCHPALSMEARVALTLRTVVGLEVDEVARAFLVSTSTMQKRLVRARAKIRDAAIPYRVPSAEQLPARTDAVLAVLYALFTEGYSGSRELVRVPLADEAIRLTRLLDALMIDAPQLPEVRGLLALMLFQHSRAAARLDADGDLVLLADQDRTRWDARMIGHGVHALAAAESARLRFDGVAGPYRLQAEIAMLHATSPSADATDFARIAELYGRLARVAPSPVVELNRAIAVSFAEGPDAGLAVVDAIDGGALDGYHLLHATIADLQRRAGRDAEALGQYQRAVELAPTEAERRFLRRRIVEVGGSPSSPR
ncbi:RNA polymerase sigma factor [Microbacterium hydrocarbonoxydans]|uniref:RNA polymerase sigma factor n=1 Tax=Microbacterium hydrocarbonoxydans TaxID=273678 RepID=UPI00203DDBB7|nr:sigma-70 family RNA polymerase sigma factor [Microbacterium hydrocarbonoxydans]MCM3781301.1 sigma-70 family RNA polymerase sigma factor [Microbacterium hydrocarbonoxydans]